MVNGVHSSSITAVWPRLLYCLTLRGSVQSFQGQYSVLFHLYAKGRQCYAAWATR